MIIFKQKYFKYFSSWCLDEAFTCFHFGFFIAFVEVTFFNNGIILFSRWEDGLAERLEYDSSGNFKTEVVRSPFVQVF